MSTSKLFPPYLKRGLETNNADIAMRNGVDKPIINSPFEEPAWHFCFGTREGTDW